MHLYDTVLKSLLTGSPNSFFSQITGARRGRWLNVELPKVNQLRMDSLFEVLPSRRLLNVEFQLENDSELPSRMAEYSVTTHHLYRRYPEQMVLYVGEAPLSMPSELVTPFLICRYTIVDIRNWEAGDLLKSPHISDTILAILARHSERPENVRRILLRIGRLKTNARKAAFTKLLLLSKLRRLSVTIEREAERMPINLDIMDHEIFGPILRKRSAEAAEQGMQRGMQRGLKQGMQQGVQQGIRKGMQQGRTEGVLSLVQRLIAVRFGPVTPATKRRLMGLSLPELEELATRLLTAKTLKDALQR